MTAIAVDATLVGGITILQSLLGAGFLYLFAKRLVGKRLVPALAVLHFGTAVGVLLLASGSLLTVAVVGVITTGTLRAIAQPVVEAWTNHFTKTEHRATVHSFLGQAQSMGEITGGISLGVVASLLNISAALVVSCVVYVIAAGLAAAARRHWSAAPHAAV